MDVPPKAGNALQEVYVRVVRGLLKVAGSLKKRFSIFVSVFFSVISGAVRERLISLV